MVLEMINGGPGEWVFARWQKPDMVNFLDRQLGLRIEGPQRFQFIIEQVEAVREV